MHEIPRGVLNRQYVLKDRIDASTARCNAIGGDHHAKYIVDGTFLEKIRRCERFGVHVNQDIGVIVTVVRCGHGFLRGMVFPIRVVLGVQQILRIKRRVAGSIQQPKFDTAVRQLKAQEAIALQARDAAIDDELTAALERWETLGAV